MSTKRDQENETTWRDDPEFAGWATEREILEDDETWKLLWEAWRAGRKKAEAERDLFARERLRECDRAGQAEGALRAIRDDAAKNLANLEDEDNAKPDYADAVRDIMRELKREIDHLLGEDD